MPKPEQDGPYRAEKWMTRQGRVVWWVRDPDNAVVDGSRTSSERRANLTCSTLNDAWRAGKAHAAQAKEQA